MLAHAGRSSRHLSSLHAFNRFRYIAQSGGADEVGHFLSQRRYRWKTLLDPDARLARTLGVGAVPTLSFVDRHGVIRTATLGYTSESGIRLRL